MQKLSSPWLDKNKPNLFRNEFRVAEEKLSGLYSTPIQPYLWIYENSGEDLFFRGLAAYAPMFAARAYSGEVAIWTSPPPSGLGNVILMVMGHDSSGKLRLVGGNYFLEPTSKCGTTPTASNFFDEYDKSDQYEKERVVKDVVERSISSCDTGLLASIRRECDHFHTMGVYITVLTANGSLFHAAKAVIEGDRPADFSYECFGETL